MSRLTEQLRIIAAVLILSLLMMSFGSQPATASPCWDGHDVVAVEFGTHTHEHCEQQPCADQARDHCCLGSCAVILATQMSSFTARLKHLWDVRPIAAFSGLGPRVNKHPPRDRY